MRRRNPRSATTLELDLSTVEPNIAGPRRPQDRVSLGDVKTEFNHALEEWQQARAVVRNGKSVEYGVARMENEGGVAVAAPPLHFGGPEAGLLRRCGRDRRDHLVHEHVEPRRDDRRRTAGA